MVAVSKDPAAPPHHTVETPGEPDREPLHPFGEGAVVVGLDQQVQVVALDREVHYAELAPPHHRRERGLDGAERATAPQVPHVIQGSQRDVHRESRSHLGPAVMGSRCPIAGRLPPGATAAAAVAGRGWQFQGELAVGRHLDWA